MKSSGATRALNEHFSAFSKILLTLCDLNVVWGLFMIHNDCARLDWFSKTQFRACIIISDRKSRPILVGPRIEHKNGQF